MNSESDDHCSKSLRLMLIFLPNCSFIIFDILPSLKQMGFLDTNARNPDITIAGITLAFQFGNALPKYIY